jgi:RHS repeat-associated protein
VAWSARTQAFGQTAVDASASITNNLRFAGQYYDQETGLHYNWMRYYDPKIGRYLSSDPIGLAGGLNTFLYASANPLRYIDPTGLWGLGVSAGGTIETGAGSGFGAQASSGIGVFGGGSAGINTGGFTNSGAFAGTARPDQFVDGATVGLGGGIFITNAKCAKELLGSFDTWTLNLPIISFQYATDSKIWTGSFSIGRSFGFSVSRYKVTTTTVSGCECQ